MDAPSKIGLMLLAGSSTIPRPLISFIHSALVGAIAAAIGVPLVFALLRKSKIYQQPPGGSPKVVDSDGKYRKWRRLASVLVLAYAAVIAVALWFLFFRVNALFGQTRGPALFILTTFPVFFATPALFLGIFLSAIPLRWTAKAFLGADVYRNLRGYSGHQQGFNSRRLFRHMVIVIAPILLVSVVLAWLNYATVTPSGLTIHPYFSLGSHTYNWAGVRHVVLVKSFRAPNGSVRHHHYYVIETSDGNGINFQRTLLFVPLFKQRQIADYVADHAGLKIEVVDPFPDG